MKTTLGDRLRMARTAVSLTQQQVAEDLGVTRSAVTHWENGTSIPTQNKIEAYAKMTGAYIRWLETGKGDAGPTLNNGVGALIQIKKSWHDMALIERLMIDAFMRLRLPRGEAVFVAKAILEIADPNFVREPAASEDDRRPLSGSDIVGLAKLASRKLLSEP